MNTFLGFAQFQIVARETPMTRAVSFTLNTVFICFAFLSRGYMTGKNIAAHVGGC